jgi:TP901 family phage tail tape measure protein
MAKNEAQIKFKANTSEMDAGLKKMNSNIQTFNAQLRLNATQMKANAGDVSLLRDRQNILSEQLEYSRSKVQLTNEKLNEAKKIWGEDSEEVQKYTRQLLAAQNQEQAIQNALSECNSELENAENALSQTASELKNTESAYEKLSNTIESQENELQSLKNEYVNVTLEQGKSSDEAKNLEEKITALNKELSNNKEKLNTAEEGANQLTNAIDDAGSSAQNAGEGGFTVFKGVVADLASNAIQQGIDKIKEFGEDVIDSGMDFGTATSQLAATMGTTKDSIGELTEFAEEMGAKTKFNATEAAEGLNALAMSGQDATEQMNTLPSVLNLASAGSLGLEQAATYTTGAIKGFKDSTENAQKYVDIMAKGATMANTDVSGLGEALSSSAATASSYSQTVEGTSLALLKLAEQNVTGSEAATSLNRAMADLFTPTAEAKDALDSLGVSAYDLSTGAARDINDVMNDLKVALSGVSEEEKNATLNTIFTTNGLEAYNKMSVTTAEKAKEFADGIATASDAMDGQGAAAEQAATQLDNLGGDVTLMQSAFDGFKMQIYNDVDGPLRETVQGITSEAIPAMSEMYEGVKSGVKFLNEHKTAVTVTAVVIGSLAAGIGAYNVVQGIKMAMEAKEVTTLGGLIAAQLGLNAAMLTSPITWIVAGVVALVAGFILLWNKCEGFRNFWTGAWNTIKTGFSTAVSGISTGVEKVKGFFGGLKEAASEKLKGLQNTFTENGGGIKGAAAVYMSLMEGEFKLGYNAINKLTGGKLDEVKEAASEKLGELKGIASEKLKGVQDTFTENGGGIKGAAAVYMSLMEGEFKLGYNAINKLTGGKLDEVKEAASEKLGALRGIASEKLKGVQDTFTENGGGIKGAAAVYMSLMEGEFKLGYNAINKLTGGKLDEVKSTFQSHGGGIKGAAAVIMSGVRSSFKVGFDAINTLTGGKLATILTTITGKLDSMRQKFKSAVDFVRKLFNFKFVWPHVFVPTLTVKWLKEGSLFKAAKLLGLEGMPSFGVHWNAKGAIFTKATIFGFAGNEFQGAGEAGPEALLPINTLEEYIGNKMAEFVGCIPVIDYEMLENVVANAVSKQGITIVYNNREVGRMIRDANRV